MQNITKRKNLFSILPVVLSTLFISPNPGIFAQTLPVTKSKAINSAIKKTPPDYNIVFPQNKVNRIEISIKAEDWKKLTANLTAKFGKNRQGFMPGPPPDMSRDSMGRDGRPGMFPGDAENDGRNDSLRMPPPNQKPNFSRRMPPPQLGGGRLPRDGMRPPTNLGNQIADIYVPVTIQFEDKQWSNIGFRFKGNSSLMMSWSQGIKKLPFRLKFGKYGDSIPQIKGQNFFGFKELTFTNNISDSSFMHEKIASDLFREAGIKSAHTAFYEVYVDYGEGLQYFGLYTTIEIVEDRMLEDQFGSNKGNCYKPDGQAGSFANGTFDKKSFVKKTHKKEADWSDVNKLYSVLNSATRTSDPQLWIAQMDSIFDISVFIKWLAVNTTIQNWDTYGQMPHNYYLYNNPKNQKLTWIPWDNNESLNSRKRNDVSFSLSEVSSEWPLIRYLLDQPEYVSQYKKEVTNFVNEVFTPSRVKGKTEKYYQLIYPSVLAEKKGFTFLPSINSFEDAKKELIQHTETRYRAAKEFTGEK
jgi:spore coat protein CotH